MEEFEDDITLTKFKYIIEYEINRLDSVISNFISEINSIEFHLYASVLSVLIFLSQFVSNINNTVERNNMTITLFLIVTAIAFSIFALLPFTSRNRTVDPVVKNISYQEVLKDSTRDKEIYKEKLLIPNIKILFFLHILFGFLILSPYYLDTITIIKWDMAFNWVAYFVTTDIITYFVFFTKNETLNDWLFDIKAAIESLKNIDLSKSSKKKKTLIILVIILCLIWLFLYPIFWYYLTFDFLIINSNSIILMANKNYFLFILILFITFFAINSKNKLIIKNYKKEILTLKQEKYREIRRQLYEVKEPDIQSLWQEFKLNAPW